jgi:hypothetical protein
LENAEIVQQSLLIHINEAIDGHDFEVIEATPLAD